MIEPTSYVGTHRAPESADSAILEAMITPDDCFEAIDGCTVEPAGTCDHGHPSWMIVLSLI